MLHTQSHISRARSVSHRNSITTNWLELKLHTIIENGINISTRTKWNGKCHKYYTSFTGEKIESIAVGLWCVNSRVDKNKKFHGNELLQATCVQIIEMENINDSQWQVPSSFISHQHLCTRIFWLLVAAHVPKQKATRKLNCDTSESV